MCGIAGILHFDGRPVDEHQLERMTRALSHRGPDGQGLHIDGSLGLGHRRLSIIDLSGGAQPMANEDGSVRVSFNGEIYNFLELQRDLERRGHCFATSCDTEVIVHAYEEWGAACVEKFRGMFAFAIDDARRQELFLARDRLGVKPLVYALNAKRLAFASELGALETLHESLEIETRAIGDYLRFQYVPAPRTIYRDVWKLPPGHTLTFKRDGQTRGPQPYWSVQFSAEARSEADWLEELDATLRDAVRLRLRSDVPFGAFLSGGVDSSVVVAYMSELLDEPVRTFCIGFEEQEYSETRWAEQAAQTCGTQHFEQIVRADALEVLPELVAHYGEPFGDSSALPTYYVSKLARQHVKMVLSGDGGDESFCGYSTYLNAAQRNTPQAMSLPRRAKRVAGTLARQIGLLPALSSPLDFWLQNVLLARDDDWNNLTRRSPLENLDLPPEIRASKTPRSWDFYNGIQALDYANYLPSSILTKVDIASMCHGLEVRGPLLDHRVVELAARVPSPLKIGLGPDGTPEGKRLLKKIALKFYPEPFVRRPKMGFSVPLGHWLKGARLHEVGRRLLDSQSRLGEVVNLEGVRGLIEAQEQRGDKFPVLWLLLVLDEWFRQHPRAPLRVD